MSCVFSVPREHRPTTCVQTTNNFICVPRKKTTLGSVSDSISTRPRNDHEWRVNKVISGRLCGRVKHCYQPPVTQRSRREIKLLQERPGGALWVAGKAPNLHVIDWAWRLFLKSLKEELRECN
ncbi:hypothetical protein AVEN_215204-1 [Araneus ventricosus]|uniref:Uncharacterized protein n=1 Tax=Araneus ventricosus TaxID=182803 RepID=A0A4Y2SK82_ARAVE|nr:hypothetical protein AVEN_215204-1 [Araneus ventricosus]